MQAAFSIMYEILEILASEDLRQAIAYRLGPGCGILLPHQYLINLSAFLISKCGTVNDSDIIKNL